MLVLNKLQTKFALHHVNIAFKILISVFSSKFTTIWLTIFIYILALNNGQFTEGLTPSLLSYSTKSDIHGIIMNPSGGWALSAPHSGKNVISPHIIPKTKGPEESLIS